MKKYFFIIFLLFLFSCSRSEYTLPKEFHGGIIRGKSEQLTSTKISIEREYHLAIMAKDSVLYAVRVPYIFYTTYNKGDTIK